MKVYVDNDDLYNADQAVKKFGKEHKIPLSEEEREELGDLLKTRARAFSDALGVEASSVAD